MTRLLHHMANIFQDNSLPQSGTGLIHADRDELLRYLSCQDKSKIKKVILVHGEKQTQENFAQTLNENGYSDVFIPSKGECLEI